jgi:hypothetical protein
MASRLRKQKNSLYVKQIRHLIEVSFILSVPYPEWKTTFLVVLFYYSPLMISACYICKEYFVWDPASAQNLYEVKTGCEHGGGLTL